MNTGKKNRPGWSDREKEFLFSHLEKLDISQIARELGKTEQAVRLFLLRRRIRPKTVVKNNLVLIIIKTAFAGPEYFKPTRAFYEAVKIGQKRWWSLYTGTVRATDEECLRVARHLNVDMKDLFENRQTELFP
jgi:hypothetical protein